MVYSFNISALGKQTQVNLCEIEPSLIYIDSSRADKAHRKTPERKKKRGGGGRKERLRELGLESIKWTTTLPCPSPRKQTIIQDIKIYYRTIVVK